MVFAITRTYLTFSGQSSTISSFRIRSGEWNSRADMGCLLPEKTAHVKLHSQRSTALQTQIEGNKNWTHVQLLMKLVPGQQSQSDATATMARSEHPSGPPGSKTLHPSAPSGPPNHSNTEIKRETNRGDVGNHLTRQREMHERYNHKLN